MSVYFLKYQLYSIFTCFLRLLYQECYYLAALVIRIIVLLCNLPIYTTTTTTLLFLLVNDYYIVLLHTQCSMPWVRARFKKIQKDFHIVYKDTCLFLCLLKHLY